MIDVCRIRVLPELLVKQIAAGEVVERPASVVKELLENAIDAGAGRIAVTIEDGGKQLIRVTDDGGGMSADELRLAVTAHATSKVTSEDDLFAIGTLGFRGEALASISAVSKLRLVSRRPDTVEGHEVRVAARAFESSQAAGCPVGTTVEVRDLFFNVPARRKFLRTSATEVGQINEQVARIALSFPRIALSLKNNSRVTLNLPASQTRLERITKSYGPDLATALLHIERDERGVRLEAYVAPPSQSRATAQWQYTFVNGRYIRDRAIQFAIKEAHRGLTEPNRHGVVFLFLTVDPKDVDVNVHPTKIEVRWADTHLIRSQVLSAIRETFQQADLTPAVDVGRLREPLGSDAQDRIRSEMADLMKRAEPIRSGAGSPGPDRSSSAPPSSVTDHRMLPGFTAPDPMRVWKDLYGSPPQPGAEDASPMTPGEKASADVARDEGMHTTNVAHPPTSGTSPPGGAGPRAIQMHNLYLVAETEDGIIIVDQHALHERITYEQLRTRLTKGPLESQRLLLPETITVTPRQADLLESSAELLKRLGIEVSSFGTDAVAVQSFPALLKNADIRGFMRDLLDRLAQPVSDPTTDAVIDDVLSMMACKAAVKAGDSLTPEEIDALFAHRELIDKPSSCPHGRPTTLRLTKADLERQFHRR